MKTVLFPSTIGRISFLARWLSLGVILSGLMALRSRFEEAYGRPLPYLIASIIVMAILLGHFAFFIVAPRIKSAGFSRWMMLVILLPAFNVLMFLALLFIPPALAESEFKKEPNQPLEPTAPSGRGSA